MANNNIIIDVESGLMARDFFSTFPSDAKTFVYGDTVELSITAVKRNTGIDAAERPWVLLDMTDKTFHVATGSTDRLPIAGEWGLLTSAAMDYNATASEVEVALNAEATISAEGGLDVTALSDGGWRLTYKTTGAKTALSVGINTMLPTSGVYISEQRAGDATNKAVVLVTLETQANSYLEMTDDIPAPTVTIEQVRNGDVAQELAEVQRVHMTGEAISGTYAITLDGVATGEIAFDADAIDITTAIAALPIIAGDESLVSVTGDSRDFTVTFDSSLGDLSNLVVDYSNLNGLNGKTGILNLNTVETLELLNGGKNSSALLEILWYNTAQSNGETIHQSTVTIVQDVIPSTPPSVTPIPVYADAVHAHAISDVTNLQTELDGKADTGHTHAISDVTNLQTELDGKADTGHTHAISDVTNLQTELDSKADTGHTHAISDVTSLQTELDDINDLFETGTWTPVIADASSGGNVGSYSSHTSKYTKVGNLVQVYCQIFNIDTSGLTASNNLHILGLPFTASAEAYGTCSLQNYTFPTNVYDVQPRIVYGGAYLTFTETRNSANRLSTDVSQFASGTADIFFTLTYQTT